MGITRKCIAECAACSISIGEGYEETQPFKIGETILCGDCYTRLLEGGRIEMAGIEDTFRHRVRQGGLTKVTSLYLYPDGSIKRELVTLPKKGT